MEVVLPLGGVRLVPNKCIKEFINYYMSLECRFNNDTTIDSSLDNYIRIATEGRQRYHYYLL